METRFLYTAADANYFSQAAVLVKSLSATQKSSTEIVVFGAGWNRERVSKLQDISYGNVSVEVISIDKTQFTDIKLSHGFPLATAYNLIAPKYLLEGYDHAIYMDADIVILDDLGDVWNQKLTTPVSAVADAHIGFIGFPSMWRPWRELEITEKCLDLLVSFEMPCIDQDALNLVLNGKFDHMHPRFNLMPYHLMKKLRTVDISEKPNDIQDAIKNPAMIHFHRSFLGKPWVRGCSHPARKLWTSIADEVSPRWRKSNDMIGALKQAGAKFANMSELDESSITLSSLNASNLGCNR